VGMAAIELPTLDDIRAVVRDEVSRALCQAMTANAPLLSVRDAARRVGVSTRTIHRRIAAGDLDVQRVGRAIRIDPAALVPPPRMVATLAARLTGR
jgi:excisionase family DNA binding protein